MAITGAIASRTKGLLPITWDALISDTRYGEAPVQTAINIAKESVFGSVINPMTEDTYSLMVIDYTAKLAALQLIPAGIDYWINMPIDEVAEGTRETQTFVDRAEKLENLRKELLAETRANMDLIEDVVGFRRVRTAPPATINTIDDEFLTPSPQEFPRPYSATGRS